MDPNVLREYAQRLVEMADFIRNTNLVAKQIVNLIRPVDALIVSLPTRAGRTALDEISLLKRKIEKSEQSVLGLKEHMDTKGHMPKSEHLPRRRV